MSNRRRPRRLRLYRDVLLGEPRGGPTYEEWLLAVETDWPGAPGQVIAGLALEELGSAGRRRLRRSGEQSARWQRRRMHAGRLYRTAAREKVR